MNKIDKIITKIEKIREQNNNAWIELERLVIHFLIIQNGV